MGGWVCIAGRGSYEADIKPLFLEDVLLYLTLMLQYKGGRKLRADIGLMEANYILNMLFIVQ